MIDPEASCWRVPHKTRRKTGRPARVVPLTPEMLALSLRLAAAQLEGPIFRNTEGKPWNRNSVRCRFRNLRRRFDREADARQARGEPAGLRLGGEATAYSYRHRFGTDAVLAGQQTKLVAEAMGHVDGRELERRYAAHVAAEAGALGAVARAVRPAGAATTRDSSSAPAPTPAASASGEPGASPAPPAPAPPGRGRRRHPRS